MTDKNALVLSGGGMRGAFQVGAIEELYKNNINWKYYIGASVGGLNAALTAQGDIDKLVELWDNIKSCNDVYTGTLVDFIFHPFKCWLYDYSPLKETIYKYVDVHKIRKRNKIVEVPAVDLKTRKIRWFSSNDEEKIFLDALLATTSIPTVFQPVQIGDGLYTDGGVRNPLPIDRLEQYKDINNVTVILASPIGRLKAYGGLLRDRELSLFDLLDLIAGISVDEMMERSLEKYVFNRITNEWNIDVLMPDMFYGKMIEFKHEKIKTAYLAGKQAAKKLLIDKGL